MSTEKANDDAPGFNAFEVAILECVRRRRIAAPATSATPAADNAEHSMEVN